MHGNAPQGNGCEGRTAAGVRKSTVRSGRTAQPMDGDRAQRTDRHQAQPMDGHRAQRTDGHRAQPMDGHQAQRTDGHQAQRTDGHWAQPMDGHRAQQTDPAWPCLQAHRRGEGHKARPWEEDPV